MSRENKILEQIELMEEIRRKADINMVTCAHCGSIMLHREFPIDGDVPDVECPYCDYKSEPNDFPDYYYEGMELSGEFKDEEADLKNECLKTIQMKTPEQINESKILLHLHLTDGMENLSTLICRLKNKSIKYSLYTGAGSSGINLSLRNIQFYNLVNGHIRWCENRSLPIEFLETETIEAFKLRVKAMLNNSTEKVVKEININ